MEDVGTSDEELFSMDDLEKDLKKGRGGRRWLWLLIGLATGVAGTIAAPIFLTPYLPDGLLGGGDLEILSGPVLGEERSGERLLLTIDTEPGALIASFTQRVDEIALLVDPGDIVTIGVEDYEPFVEDPDFEGVKKMSGSAAVEAPMEAPMEAPTEAPTEAPMEMSPATSGGESTEDDPPSDNSTPGGDILVPSPDAAPDGQGAIEAVPDTTSRS